MAYSLVGILAVVIHLIINIGVFIDMKTGHKFRGEKIYLFFLLSVIVFHIADAFWGFIYDAKLKTALFIDTTAYMIAMATSIFLWGFFVYRYLSIDKHKSKAFVYINLAVFVFQMLTVLINLFPLIIPSFKPLLFSITKTETEFTYSAEPLRYVNLTLQIVTYLVVSTYTFIAARRQTGSDKRKHLTIGLFGLFMIIALTLQVFFPLLPMYSLGYLLGICVLHAFVVRDVLFDQEEQVNVAKQQVQIDPLTGAFSKYAYQEKWEEIETAIASGELKDFAMVMFDLNDLKLTNDTFGHEVGDKYLVDSFNLIKEYYPDIPLYRVGGDEFVAILTNGQFENRKKYLKDFNDRIDENVKNKDRLIISSGIAEYNSDKDSSILTVFTRADRDMYARKQRIKEAQEKL